MDIVLGLPWTVKIMTVAALMIVLSAHPVQMYIRDLFRRNSVIRKTSHERLTVDNATAQLIVGEIMKEARVIIRHLTREEKNVLRELNGRLVSPALSELFPDFGRSTEDNRNSRHELLRGLRKCHLIRPAGGGRWRGDKRIEITAMGRLVIHLNRNVFN